MYVERKLITIRRNGPSIIFKLNHGKKFFPSENVVRCRCDDQMGGANYFLLSHVR